MKKIIASIILLAVTIAAVAQTPSRRFGIKSGIFESTTSIMILTSQSTTYFDDYGNKTMTLMKANGMEIRSYSFAGENRMIIVNMNQKQTQVTPLPDEANFMNLSDDIIRKYGIKDNGKEMLLGKECTKYSQKVERNGQTVEGTSWVWEGLPIKTVSSVQGMTMTVEMTSLQENVEIDPYMFELPDFAKDQLGKKTLAAGDTFLDFEGVDIDSKPVKLSDYAGKGKHVLMEFWASWCGPCKQYLPILKDIYKEYGGKDLVMVSVDFSERKIEDGMNAAVEEGIIWNTIFSANRTPGELYNVQYIPRAFLIDPDGKIVATDITLDTLPELLKTLFSGK